MSMGKSLMMTVGRWDRATIRYVNAMTVRPSDEQIEIINNFIVGAKESGIWQSSTFIPFLAGNDQQSTLLNAINPIQTLVAVNNPTFIQNQGWKGVPANSSFIEFGPTSDFVSLNAGFMFGIVTGGTDAAANDRPILAQYGPPTPSNYNWVQPRGAAGTSSVRFNNTSSTQAPVTTILGSRMVIRDGNTVKSYVNGVLATTATNSPASITSAPLTLFRLSNSYSDFLCPLCAVGNQSLSDSQALNLHNLTQTYLTELGSL